MSQERPQRTKPLTRRLFLKRSAAAATAGGLAGTFAGSHALDETHVDVPIASLPPALEGFRIAFAADFHLGKYFPLSGVKSAVKKLRAFEPDLVLLGGDYILGSDDFFEPCFGALDSLEAPHGVWAVPGNHDNRRGLAAFRQAASKTRVTTLVNEGAAVGPAGKLWIAGLDDMWGGGPNMEEASAGKPPGAPVIAVGHNPYTADEIPPGSADLILSGHTHGWQIYVPLVTRALVPENMARYRAGFYRAKGGLLYVTRGVGLSLSRFRLWCPPEIVLFTLKRA